LGEAAAAALAENKSAIAVSKPTPFRLQATSNQQYQHHLVAVQKAKLH
jgi:hypothetical protein